MIKGIDVSEWQGAIDWAAVKAAGIEFAIIRCGYGDDIASQDDKTYAANVAGCEANGIPYGVYLFSYVDSEAHLQSEIAHTLRLVNGHKPFCVYLDLEGKINAQGISSLTAYAKRWCEAIENAGYKAGVYASSSWFDKYVDIHTLYNAGYSIWVAQYYVSPPSWADIKLDIWQYASDGSVAGINGRVDVNELYNAALIGQYNIKGSLDEATKTMARGWAYNGVNDTPVSVHIYAFKNGSNDGEMIAGCDADQFREDLLNAGIGNGCHGFTASYNLAALGEGVYTIRAYGVIGDTVKELKGEFYVTITNDDTVMPEPPADLPTDEPTPDPDDDNTTGGILATIKKLIRQLVNWAFGKDD